MTEKIIPQNASIGIEETFSKAHIQSPAGDADIHARPNRHTVELSVGVEKGHGHAYTSVTLSPTEATALADQLIESAHGIGDCDD